MREFKLSRLAEKPFVELKGQRKLVVVTDVRHLLKMSNCILLFQVVKKKQSHIFVCF